MLMNDESVHEALASLLAHDKRLGPERDADAGAALDRLRANPPIRTRAGGNLGHFSEAVPDGLARVLERVVRPEARPALIINGDDWSDPPNQALAAQLGNRAAIASAIRAVGRIEVRDHPQGYGHVGTGWLFDDGLVVTNRHVAVLFAERAQDGTGFLFLNNLVRRRRVQANIDFREERDEPAQEELEIRRILHIDDTIDVAFLELEHPPQGRSPLQPRTLDHPRDTWVAAIGYPIWDTRATSPDWLDLVFEGVYEVKRLMPGIIADARGDLLFHDCSTTGGTSGAPLIDTATGQVVGLHYGAEGADGFNCAIPIAAVQKARDRIAP